MKKVFVWLGGLLLLLAIALAAPQLTINAPTAGLTNSSNITFNITINETGTAWFNLNDGNNITMSTADNLTFTSFNDTLIDGNYTASFFANDSLNSLNDSESVFFIIDTTPAQITIVAPTASELFGTTQSILFNITTNENLSSVIGYLNGEMFSLSTLDNISWSYTNSSVPNGAYNVSFVATDMAGNANSTANVSFQVNFTIPGVTINSPSTGNFTSSTVNFNITADEIIDAAFLNLSGVLYPMTSADNLTFNYTNESVSDGVYTAFFWVNDTFGNSNSTESVSFTIDTTAPTITVTNPTNNSIINESSLNFTIVLNETGLAWFNLDNGVNISMNTMDNLTFYYFNSSLENGTYQANFFANDSLGNVRSSSVDFSINTSDVTPPIITVLSPITTIYDATVNFSILLDENGSAWYNIDNGTNVTMSTTNNTFFTFTQSNFTTGNYTVYFIANDTSGNINNSQSVSFTVDTTPPNFTIVSPSSGENFTSSSQVIFNLTANENLSSAVATLNGVNFALSTLDNISWSFTNSSVANGNYNVSFLLTDIVGNQNQSENISFSVNYTPPDTTPPGINVTNPLNTSTLNSSDINFTVTLNETGLVFYNINNGTNITMSSTDNLSFFSYNSSIADGIYFAYFFANDSNNNNATTEITFTVDTTIPDTTNPQITINEPSSSTFNESSVTFNITGNENLSVVLVEISGVNFSMTSTDNRVFNYTNSSMLDGNYTVIFWANDTSNNINNTQTASFSVDTTPPVLTLTFPANGSYILPTQVFSYSVSDTNTVTIAQALNGSSSALNSTTFTPFSSVSTSGDFILSLTGTDSLGNTNTTQNFTYFVDVDAPSINATASSLTIPSNISFSVFDGFSNISNIWYEFNGESNTTINTSINISAETGEIFNQIFAGSHDVVFYANDTAGNVGSQSVSFQINGTLNLTEEQANIVTAVENVTTTFTLANGTNVSAATPLLNNTDIQNATLEIVINQTTPIRINFSGINGSVVRWNRSLDNITDNVTIVEDALAENFSLNNFTVLTVQGQDRVFPNGSYSIISVLFDINPLDVNVLYYFEDEITFDAKTDINVCEDGSYSDGDTIPCWVNSTNQTLVYLDSFSTVVLGNDSTPPAISVVTPVGELAVSEFTPTITVSSDVDACTVYYNNTNANTTGTFNGTACSFPTINVGDGINGSLNFTVNDTAGNVNSTIALFNFSDVTAPFVNITAPTNGSTITSSSTTLSVSANETVTVTRSYNGGTFSSCFVNATSGSCSVSGLSNGVRNITINATDLSGNSVLETVFFTVNIATGSGGSSGGGGDDDDDDSSSSSRSSSSSSFSFDDDEDEDQEPVDPFSFNDTPQNYQTTIDAETEFILRINDTITVRTDQGLLTFKMVAYDDIQKTAVLEINGEQVQTSMTGAINYDSDNDGEADLMITLNNLAAGRAEVVFARPLMQEDSADEEVQEDDDTPIGTLPWLPIGIVAGVVLLILGAILFLKHHERKHQAAPKVHPPYSPQDGPDAKDFSANQFMKDEKSETTSFSANKFLKKN